MQNLTNIEINAVAGGLDSPASFFRSAAAQRIHEENHKLHHHRNHHKERNVAADTAIFVFFLGVGSHNYCYLHDRYACYLNLSMH